ncbi:diguanylate cyclase domain-containing protein [Massilia sp. GCM10020059]|uniref:Diguanylate cyclase n=1 Tax=Massilia agrisoli TaxID=2892444 RepID=A0ABS8IUF6_9BURK|nr:diguanylate cyclase [Massilia agrisoli]MCC6072249.1 diguanylate cyclase [Massilia agrisoli]
MKLAQFIRSGIEPILDEWEHQARQMPSARELDGRALRKHARGMLQVIADYVECGPGADQSCAGGMGNCGAVESHAARHGAVRLAQGFSVNDAVAEFRALRAAVMALWTERGGCADAAAEITRFNEAVDQAVADALARYAALRDYQSRLFDALLSSSPDLAFIIDPHGRIIYANRAFARHLRVEADQLPGADFFALAAAFAPEIDVHVAHVLQAQATHRGELTFTLAPGRYKTYEYLLVPVLDPQGRSEAVAGTARDVTERKEVEDRIRRSANYDHLTGLPNRSLFRERIEHEIKHAARTGLPLALLFLDLDGFKDVNDKLGHEAGDQLLQEVAHRISACVRDTDTVARLGGDEFTVVLTEVTQPAKVDSLCAKMLAALEKPFVLEAGEARVSASIGITLYPGGAASPDELLRQADAAMYAAKNAGRNRYHFFAARPPV